MEIITISLSEPLRAFVAGEVAAGGYQTAGDFVEELIRDAQQRKQQRELEDKLLQALDSGEPTPMTASDWADIRHEVRERHARRTGV